MLIVIEQKKYYTGYLPRAHQEYLHAHLKRFNVIPCHRRFGKTVFAVNEMLDQAFRNTKRSPQYAYIAPTYGQAKRVAWEIFKDSLREIPGCEINETELRIDIVRPQFGDKVRMMLLGAENPGSVRGIYLDGVIIDEYAECDPIIWTQVVRPALSDRMGWAIFLGTPKGQNHFYDIFKTAENDKTGMWYSKIFRASETNILPRSELEAARSSGMTEEEYDQEYECSFTAALVGAYYGKIINKIEADGHICRVAHDPSILTDTFWDLGVGDTTVIWFMQQVSGNEWHAIDYYEMSGMGLDHYAKYLREKDYAYGEHYLPHDGAARSLETGKTRQETLESLKIKPINIVPRQEVDDGISAVRMILPKCWFDSVRCQRGIEALKAYEKKWDAKNKIFVPRPLHNWASNGADAFRTFAMGRIERISERSKQLPERSDSSYDIFARR